MPEFEILEIRPSWPGMRHVEFRLDGTPWRDGSVPVEVAGEEVAQNAVLTAWLAANTDRYLADMAVSDDVPPGDPL